MNVFKSAFLPCIIVFISKQKDSGSFKSMRLAMEMMASEGKILSGVVMVWIEKGWSECANFF